MNEGGSGKRNVLLTGAAGRIGGAFRVYAGDRYAFRFGIHPSERIDDAGSHDVMPFDIVDLDACRRACAGIDTVVHLAADPSRKSDFHASLLDANIRGVYNIFRAAKDQGCQRVICASSIQAVEGYPTDDVIYPHSAARPVNMYGVTKCFAEAVAHCFAYGEGLSSIAVRIGTFDSERLRSRFSNRNLRTFVSKDDLCQLLIRCIETHGVLFAIAHGGSNNRVKRLDLAETTTLFGYQPRDDAFRIAEENGQSVQTEACCVATAQARRMTQSTLDITWLGQSTFIYRFPTGLVVCVDPYLSYATSNGGTRERLTPILMPASTLRAHVVVTTHDHTDHFDEHSLRPIAERAETIFVGPSSCCEHWRAMKMPSRRFVRLDRGESQDLAGATFKALYAEHDSGHKCDAIGMLINAGGFNVYQVGDSQYVPQVVDQAKGLKPDLLVVPINGRRGNMNHREAALLTQLVEPRVAIPMHYAMFRNNDANPQDFVDACREVGVDSRVVVMKPGARFELQPRVAGEF